MVARARVKHCSLSCRIASGQYEEMATELRERRGPLNPNWKHGQYEGRHTSRWTIMEKGERRCRVCQKSAAHLHHIVPRSRWPSRGRDDLRNGMPLCAQCHSDWHAGRGTIKVTHIRPEERAYIEVYAPVDPEWVIRRYPALDRPESPQKAD